MFDVLIILIIVFVILILGALVVAIFLVFKSDFKTTSFDKYNKKEIERAGEFGESIVANRLQEIAEKYDGQLFNEFIFKDRYNGKYSTEIDHVLITRGGVFVIETKYITGTIYGKECDEEWVCFKKGNLKNKTMRNPIKQNTIHINSLKKMFDVTPPKMTSIVIFLAGDITGITSNEIYSLNAAIEKIEALTNQNKYSQDFVERISGQIAHIKNVYGISKEEHIKNIKRNYK